MNNNSFILHRDKILHLEDFLAKSWIEHKKKGNRDLWKANPPKESE